MLFFLSIVVTVYAKDKLYTISDTRKTWNNAMKECESDGGYLLTLNSQQVLNDLNDGELSDPSSHEELWIGLRTADNNTECGPYTWHSGETIGSWENWYHNEPNVCDSEKCIRIMTKKWRTTRCEFKHKFICEKRANTTEVITNSTGMREATENGFTEVVSTSMREATENGFTEVVSTDSSENEDAAVTTSHPPSSINVSDVVENVSTMSETTENGFTKPVISIDSSESQEVTSSQLHHMINYSNCCTGKDEGPELKCGPVEWTNNDIHKDKTLEAEIEKLKEELKVQRNKTKIYIRSKMSVYDSRNSSVTMGMMGILVIITTIFFPVAVDVVKLITFIKNCRNKDIQRSSC